MRRRRARAKELAVAVVNLRMSPTEYRALTLHERKALIAEHNRVVKKQNRRR